ncbi:MAG: prepilin-type N-terminal cleavage/methylation domain-containing protein [Sandaracinaceae bacterium]|nr:prepilin-type N-terminal cleavage/methylation domain-containing protein [Sandaracinaceae bacterium]
MSRVRTRLGAPRARLRASRARAGFTLVEMMIALTIGAMVIATVYTIGSSAARHFQEQQRISQVQLSVRLALDRIRRDIARAGFQATMNSALDATCGPPPGTQIRGLLLQDRASAAAFAGMVDAAAVQGDRVLITGNFRTGDSYVVREWSGNQMRLGTNFLGYRRSFAAQPMVDDSIDTALVAQTFSPGTALMARLGGGMRVWTAVSTVTATSVGGTAGSATITTTSALPSCPGAVGLEGWAQGGVTVAPITQVRYEIVNATTLPALGLAPRNANVTGANTVLTRTELNPTTGAIIDGPLPILEYAVHFDVDVFSDVSIATNPSRVQIFDDAAAATETQLRPGNIRGARISLAARTSEQDSHLTQAVPALGDGTPRVFRVFGDRDGAARVRSAYTEVFIPNSSSR